MRATRRVAIAAVCLALGIAGAASPVQAAPAGGARPDVVNSAKHAVAGQKVAKDGKGRTIVYVDGADESALKAAVAKAGGEVADTDAGRVKAVVPPEKLDVVASQPGVAEVRLPDRAVPMAVTSEGVVPSRANEWVAAGKTGAGVKIGIIDVGFGDLALSQANGELPPTGTRLVHKDAGCLDATVKSEHGTNVAEVVHDMAPGADLYLACVEDSMSFSAAADWMDQQGVKIISSAVGFLSPAGGRGDGTGVQGSPADVVKRSRAKGILWSVAAGNLARTHYAAKAADASGDKWVEFRNGSQFNQINLAGNQTTTIALRWDAWPTTAEDLDLYVMDQMIEPDSAGAPAPKAVSLRSQSEAQGGLSPTEEVTITNTAGSSRSFYIYVKNKSAKFSTPFELFVAGPEQIQHWTEAGSVTEPATSPHVIAVGATEPGSGQVEEFSGRGPTVDGRTKPDIIGFDKVTTSLWPASVFRGTSAAAAHVAGAAAVLKSANPSLDASQLQTVLQSRAVRPAGGEPNTWGSGVLNLGAPTNLPTAPTGSNFSVDPVPTRVLNQEIAAGASHALGFPELPGDTKAVAITVTAQVKAGSVGDFAIEVGTGDLGTKGGQVPALHARGDSASTWQSLTFFAPLDGARSIKLRNRGGVDAVVVVDRLGYFSPQSTDTYFALPAPVRLLDTRGFPVAAGGNARRTALDVAGDKTAEVQVRGVAGVPATAQAVVANLTAFEAAEQQFVTAHGAAALPATTSVSVAQGDRRTNTVVVPIGSDGKIRVSNSTWRGVTGAALDVVGWFGSGSGGAKYVPLTDSARVADTTTGNGVPKAPVAHGQVARFDVGGIAGVPASATAAAVVLTGNDNNLGTELSAVASEVGWTRASQVTTRKLETASGLALVPLGESGEVDVRNERGQTALRADVTGYFVGGSRVATAAVAGNCVTSADEPGFGSAFDGRAESGTGGWLSTGQPMTADGCELKTADGSDVNWYTAHTYGNDYTLKVDWKAETAGSESGVLVLMDNPGKDAAKAYSAGYEIQIAPGNAEWPTGSVVGRQKASATAAKPAGQWNTYEIKVSWNTVTVLLNGTRVNQYTSDDATQTRRNTFIGLQNDNTGDAVRFRNVRVKRDTPVFSGTLASGNGKCLDIKWGDPAQSVVWMIDCHGAFAQTWASNEGMLQGGGRCLQPSGAGDGAQVVLADCGGDQSQWVRRTDGRLVSRVSGLCATPVGAVAESRVVMAACATSRSEQVWTVPDQRGRAGKVVGPGGRCLDVAGHDPTQNKAQLWGCNGNVAQSWVAPGNGTLRGDGKCLDVTGAATADGAAVALSECHLGRNQQWVAQPDGTLLNPVSGRCLTAASASDGAALSISDCTAKTTQIWRQTADWVSRGAVVGPQTRCLDVAGANPANNTITMWGCNGFVAQDWRTSGDGAVEVFSHCLGISGTGNNAPVTLSSTCDRTGGQVWSARSDGTVVNPVSGRCLDGQLGNDGDRVYVFDCHGDVPQRFATPVNAG